MKHTFALYTLNLLGGFQSIHAKIGKGCKNIPEGYVYNSTFDIYFKYIEKQDTWMVHEENCQNHDERSHLVTIQTEEKNTFITSMLTGHAALGFGRLDRDHPEKFSWLSEEENAGYTTGFTNWYKTEPNSEDQKCSLVYGGRGKHRRGFWHDVVCDWAGMHGVCEIQCEPWPVDEEHDSSSKPEAQTSEKRSDRAAFTGIHGNLFLEKVFASDQALLDSFYEHGCWCGATNTLHTKPKKGKPINELDFACRDWLTCTNCNKARDDVYCSGQEDYEATATDDELSCVTQNNLPCGEARCQCDLLLALNAKQFIASLDSETLELTEVVDCVRHQGPSEHPKNRCCGAAPFYEKFNDQQAQCIGNELQEL